LRANATYSQKVPTPMLAMADMPRLPRLPHSNPAATVAMTPEPATASAATNECRGDRREQQLSLGS
jgi:hypothetical protein